MHQNLLFAYNILYRLLCITIKEPETSTRLSGNCKQATLTLFRHGSFLLPATGKQAYNFKTAHPTATNITHNNVLIIFNLWVKLD